MPSILDSGNFLSTAILCFWSYIERTSALLTVASDVTVAHAVGLVLRDTLFAKPTLSGDQNIEQDSSE